MVKVGSVLRTKKEKVIKFRDLDKKTIFLKLLFLNFLKCKRKLHPPMFIFKLAKTCKNAYISN